MTTENLCIGAKWTKCVHFQFDHFPNWFRKYAHLCQLDKICAFSVWPLPELIPKADLKKNLYFHYKKITVCWRIKLQIRPRIVFSKSDSTEFFFAIFFSEKAITHRICSSFTGKVGEAQFLKCYVSPPPPKWGQLLHTTSFIFLNTFVLTHDVKGNNYVWFWQTHFLRTKK